MANREYLKQKIKVAKSKLQHAENVLTKLCRGETVGDDALELVEASCKQGAELTNHALTAIYRSKRGE